MFQPTLKFLLVCSFLFCSTGPTPAHAKQACQLITQKTAPEYKRVQPKKSQFRFEPSGEENAPLHLEIKNGKQEINMSSATTCFLHFSLRLPTSVTLKVSASDDPPVDMTVTASSTEPKLAMQGTPARSSPNRMEVDYTLPRADYLLKLAATRPGKVTLVIENVAPQAPVIDLAVSGTELMLDPISRSAFRKFYINRRSVVTFSLSNVPDMGKFVRAMSVNVLDIDGNPALETDSNEYDDVRKFATYILAPGAYFVVADGTYNGWPSPLLQEPILSRRIGLHVDALSPYVAPASMDALSHWLHATGLDGLIQFNELVDFRNARRNVPDAYRRLFSLAADVAYRRTQKRTCAQSASDCEVDDDFLHRPDAKSFVDGADLAWPAGSILEDRPALLVKFSVKKDRNFVRATEAAFEKEHGVSLWHRLLQKIGHLETVSAKRIVVLAPVWCDGSLVYLDGDSAYRHGPICLSGSSAVPLSLDTSVNSSVSATLSGKRRNLSDSLPVFLKQFFNNNDVRYDYLAQDPDYVEVIIRGLRGQIISGGKDWEKFLLTVSITGADPRMLRATVDGQLASGIGTYPADTQFTRDMDTQFKGNVNEYSKKLIVGLRKFLERSP